MPFNSLSAGRIVPAVLALLALSACGGGGGSSSPRPQSYSIGGSVSGLTASGLVLTDNGADDLSVPASATSFTFATQIGAGNSYAVAVKSQPQGQTCTVSSGSGTVGGPVSSVSVACQNATYSVGGTISGLSASGLVLTDNGGDDLSVAANATSFTFATALAGGSHYAVAVKTQPQGETCAVSNGSGTVSGAVTSVSVACQVAFTIGGSVSGLTAYGLVLSDNGGDDLDVAPLSSTFTFATALATGSAYDVSVKTQPPGTTCSVTGGSGSASADVTSVSVSCASNFAGGAANVANVTVGPGPASASYQTFNMPYVTVTVCDSGGTCANIPDVLVDTASTGLRVMASALQSLTFSAMKDPANASNTISECLPFADGSLWGQVSLLTVKIAGEASSSPIPVQVIDDSQGLSVDAECSGAFETATGGSPSVIDLLDANGVLGVNINAQDCGSACAPPQPAGNVYWSCTGSAASTCSKATLAVADQVANPVTSFSTDNNGVIVQLPAIDPAGAPTATGYLAFGIGTETNNHLGSATVLTTDNLGQFTTQYKANSLTNSFIDSGSNALFFTDSIATCSTDAAFYCPMSPLSLSATNTGQNGTTSTVPFQVVDLENLDPNNFALMNVAGTAPAIGNWQYFDWGAPFLYGRTISIAIDGQSAEGTQGPYVAY